MEDQNNSFGGADQHPQTTITLQEHERVVAEKNQALESLQAQIDTLTTADSQRVSDLAEASKIIEGQKAQIDVHEATIATLQGVKSDVVTVTVDGKVYAITAPSALIEKDRTVTAADIVADKKLAAALVKKGVGFLELITADTSDRKKAK